MIIRYFPRIKAAFIHIPKTGGSTISNYLKAAGRQDFTRVLSMDGLPDRGAGLDLFCVVRNPFDRFISSWAYCKKMGWESRATPPYAFLQRVKSLSHDPRGQTVAEHWIWNHSAPQTHRLTLYWSADRVYRFERFNWAISDLGKRYNFKPTARRNNASGHKPWRDYYRRNPRLIEAVAAYYFPDFCWLGYAPGGLSTQR